MHVLHARLLAVRGRLLDLDLDGDRAGMLEVQGERELLAFLERLLQADQHQVQAAGRKLGLPTGGDVDRLHRDHLADTLGVDRRAVQFRRAGHVG